MTTTVETVDLELADIHVDDLHPADDNPRHDLGDLTELAASIASIGILQPLVVVERAVGGGYTIVAGHRRHAAAKAAGVERVPCVVRTLSHEDRQTAMLVENLQRVGLDPLDEAAGFAKLTELGLSQRQIAERVGCNQSHVSRRLALQGLVDRLRDAVRRGNLELRAAERAAKLPDDAQQQLAKLADVTVRPIPGWQVDEVARRHERDKRIAASRVDGEASGLPEIAQNYWDHPAAERDVAVGWRIDVNGNLLWLGPADGDEVADAAPSATPKAAASTTTDDKVTGESWEERRASERAQFEANLQTLRVAMTEDPDRVKALGLQAIVDELANEDSGRWLELDAGAVDPLGDSTFADLTDDPALLVAVVFLAGFAHESTLDDWPGIARAWAQLRGDDADGIAEGDGEVSLDDTPDTELPGMWERADFTGGETDINEQFAVVDGEPAPVDDSGPPAAEVVQEPEAPQVSDPAPVDDADDFWDPVAPPKRPWPTYDGNDERLICKMVGNFTVAAAVHEVIAYETATLGRAAILEQAEATLAKLAERAPS